MSTPETTMKLSEAIRLGAMLKPQWFGFADSFGNTRTCAIQAAFDAIGQLGNRIPAFHFWPIVKLDAVCPESCCIAGLSDDGVGLDNVIIHLNDAHHWTRERIADWVATIEAQQEQQQAEPVAPAMEVAKQ